MISTLFALVFVATADPAAAAPPSADAPTTSASPATALPAPDAKSTGMDTMPTAATQIAAGVGGCCVGGCISVPCAFVPFVGGVLSNVVTGATIGAAEVVVGDAVGKKRGALLVPAAASAGVLVVGGLVNMAVSVALGASAVATPIDINNPAAALNAAGPAFAATMAISLVSTAAALVVPAVIYQATAVDKQPGDAGGFGVPGITEPADPTGTRAKASKPATPAATPPATPATPATSSSEPPPPAVSY